MRSRSGPGPTPKVRSLKQPDLDPSTEVRASNLWPGPSDLAVGPVRTWVREGQGPDRGQSNLNTQNFNLQTTKPKKQNHPSQIPVLPLQSQYKSFTRMRTQALLSLPSLIPSTGVQLSSKSRDLSGIIDSTVLPRGLVYLEKLGLGGVIVVENDEHPRGEQDEPSSIIDEVMRIVTSLEKQGSRARPVIGAIVKLGPKTRRHSFVGSKFHPSRDTYYTLWSHPHSLSSQRRRNFCYCTLCPWFNLPFSCADVTDVIAGLARGIVEASSLNKTSNQPSQEGSFNQVDLTPLRLMIINWEGHTHVTTSTRPLIIAGISRIPCLYLILFLLGHTLPICLQLPPLSWSLTDKPALSSSLPHALLQGNRKLTRSSLPWWPLVVLSGRQ